MKNININDKINQIGEEVNLINNKIIENENENNYIEMNWNKKILSLEIKVLEQEKENGFKNFISMFNETIEKIEKNKEKEIKTIIKKTPLEYNDNFEKESIMFLEKIKEFDNKEFENKGSKFIKIVMDGKSHLKKIEITNQKMYNKEIKKVIESLITNINETIEDIYMEKIEETNRITKNYIK
ncbi:MAG: hypothetical protein ACRC4M_04225 [Mycoplasma sp.]